MVIFFAATMFENLLIFLHSLMVHRPVSQVLYVLNIKRMSTKIVRKKSKISEKYHLK